MKLKIEHIGIAVKDLEQSRKKYESLLGMPTKDIENVNVDNVSYQVAFLPVGDINIELVCTDAKSGIVFDWLEKRGEGVFHLAYEVNNLEQTYQYLKSKGVKFVWDKIQEGSRGTKVVLIKPDEFNGVYIELLQKKPS